MEPNGSAARSREPAASPLAAVESLLASLDQQLAMQRGAQRSESTQPLAPSRSLLSDDSMGMAAGPFPLVEPQQTAQQQHDGHGRPAAYIAYGITASASTSTRPLHSSLEHCAPPASESGSRLLDAAVAGAALLGHVLDLGFPAMFAMATLVVFYYTLPFDTKKLS